MWDRGTWTVEGDFGTGYLIGHLKFHLFGKKLRGGWSLVRMLIQTDPAKQHWLLMKESDAEALMLADLDLLESNPTSVLSGRSCISGDSAPGITL